MVLIDSHSRTMGQFEFGQAMISLLRALRSPSILAEIAVETIVIHRECDRHFRLEFDV